MGSCKNCGHRIEDDDTYCSNTCIDDYSDRRLEAREMREEMECSSCGEKKPCICEEEELQEAERYEATLEGHRENEDFKEKHKE